MSDRSRLKFGILEIGRGVAASLVVLHHAGNIVTQPRFFDAEAFGGHLGNFNVGVDFFFVLSGFIIAWVHWNDIGDPSKLRRYALKRFLRIYPPYWGILFPLAALYLMFPGAGIPSQHDPANIVMSALLLPYPYPPVLGVAWTLVHEVFFYVLFAVVISVGRKGLWLLPLWAAAIVAASFAGELPFPVSFFLSPFNIEFILGVGAAGLLRHRTVPMPWVVAISGAVAFLLMTLFAVHIQDNPLVGRLAFGFSAVAFVLGIVEIERRHPIRLPAALALFGASSYAVYLVHPIALSFLVQLATRFAKGSMPLEAVVLLIAVMAAVTGVVYHLVVEKPLGRLAARMTGHPREVRTLPTDETAADWRVQQNKV